MKDMISRFWSKVDKKRSDTFYKGTRCWVWTASTLGEYGHIKIKNKARYAHRISYEMTYKFIPKDKFVCHHCDNKLCVRPSHLFLGTQKDNIQDAINKKRTAKGETHGKAKLTEEQVKQIRANPRSERKLALEYNVRYCTIGNIKRRKTWKHI